MASHTIHATQQASPVCPVTATDVGIERAGRNLLSIPHVAFGSDVSQGSRTEGSRTEGSLTKGSLTKGSCTMIVGPNGAGKSLLVRTLCALQVPDTGRVRWAGNAPDTARRHQVGLMLQKPVLLRRSALANLLYALRQTALPREQCQSLALDALQQAGLAQLCQVPAHRLSGGEQQRLALARALLLKPDILFLDEATASVDPASTLVIEQQLRESIGQGLVVVMVTHDQAQVQRLGQHVLLMHNGRVIEQASRCEFFDTPAHELTRRWIAGEILV